MPAAACPGEAHPDASGAVAGSTHANLAEGLPLFPGGRGSNLAIPSCRIEDGNSGAELQPYSDLPRLTCRPHLATPPAVPGSAISPPGSQPVCRAGGLRVPPYGGIVAIGSDGPSVRNPRSVIRVRGPMRPESRTGPSQARLRPRLLRRIRARPMSKGGDATGPPEPFETDGKPLGMGPAAAAEPRHPVKDAAVPERLRSHCPRRPKPDRDARPPTTRRFRVRYESHAGRKFIQVKIKYSQSFFCA